MSGEAIDFLADHEGDPASSIEQRAVDASAEELTPDGEPESFTPTVVADDETLVDPVEKAIAASRADLRRALAGGGIWSQLFWGDKDLKLDEVADKVALDPARLRALAEALDIKIEGDRVSTQGLLRASMKAIDRLVAALDDGER